VDSALPFPTSHFGGQGVESLLPKRPEWLEPIVYFLEGLRLEGVHAAGAGGADADEPRLPEQAKVLGHTGLRDPEFGLNDLPDLAGRPHARGKKLQDAPANRIAQHVEGVHSQSPPTDSGASGCSSPE
jgi:hypothetical protein